MREILFRGKTINSNEWVESMTIANGTIKRKRDDLFMEISEDKWVGVIPETVGLFIGVKGYEGDYENRHKNEVKLFEGDIVEAMSEGSKGTFVIKFRNEAQPTFMLFPAWHGGKMWSIAASDVGRAKGDYYDDLKRIGNIHDNPELINP